jgi:hypothetical protein
MEFKSGFLHMGSRSFAFGRAEKSGGLDAGGMRGVIE